MQTTASPTLTDNIPEAACPNCSVALLGRYCHACGSCPVDEHELSVKHFAAHSVHEFTHVEQSKVLSTLRNLLLKPGFLTLEYFSGRKLRYLTPLRVFLMSAALFLFLLSLFPQYNTHDFGQMVQSDQSGNLSKMVERNALRMQLSPEQLMAQVSARWHKVATYLQVGYCLVLALALQLIVGIRRSFYVKHLVYSMHLFSFVFLLSSVFWVIRLALGAGYYSSNLWIEGIRMSMVVGYMFLSIRRFYGFGNVGACVRTGLLTVSYLLIMYGFHMLSMLLAIWSVMNT